MNKLNELNELSKIELFQFDNPKTNETKNKIKKIVIYSLAFIGYTLSLIGSTYTIIEKSLNKNNNTC
jgi:hypothetical protein